jgi:Ca-activated chloride channel family protein
MVMKSTAVLSIARPACALCACFAAAIEPAASQRPTFRTEVQTVAVYATVIDSGGRLVPDLDRAAFRVLDDGRPANIVVFSNESQPITAAVMLDMSGSMVTRFLTVREATRCFVDALAAGDRARIGTFGSEVAISPLLTGDKAVLERILQEELWPGGATPLFRATMAAMDSLSGESGRRVVLVLSDGRDTDTYAHRPRVDDVRRRAVREAFMIYAVGLEGPGFAHELADMAEETGGGHFELKSDADLGKTFARVAEELRHQYLIGFAPAALDGKVHRLDIDIDGGRYKVRAARSYLAGEAR